MMSVSLPPLTFVESSIMLAFLHALVELSRGRTWHHMYALSDCSAESPDAGVLREAEDLHEQC